MISKVRLFTHRLNQDYSFRRLTNQAPQLEYTREQYAYL